jgi:hypothetical protein
VDWETGAETFEAALLGITVAVARLTKLPLPTARCVPLTACALVIFAAKPFVREYAIVKSKTEAWLTRQDFVLFIICI